MPLGTDAENQKISLSLDSLGPLPTGWEERLSEDGRIFFINHTKKKTTETNMHNLQILMA